ncbi:S9 family peptidase [Lysobacter sp. 5GHs7-4]|uniref:alpha/beta hydrolase family protein n=1 Tax=Lysobacter sp. 5GHs7-4 TaxID=2904253 RepID=UPI001E341BA5|nr:S9 family peptidase [Lysobacter sp. 5GHs7-4]UHQ24509.1 S9 family peptidase [Lysobacter sp. 5GHs7-4]
MRVLLLAALLATTAATAANAWAGTPTLDDFLKDARFEQLILSPSGEYFVVKVPQADRTVMAILRRDDLKLVAHFNPGANRFVDDYYWVSDRRVYATILEREGKAEQPDEMLGVRWLDVDGKNGASWGANVLSFLDEPGMVLVRGCDPSRSRLRSGDRFECASGVYKRHLDDELGKKRKEVVGSPEPDSEFLADSKGRVSFSWSWDKDSKQHLYRRQGEQWLLVNDESVSGVSVTPYGTSADGRYGYLWSERKQGPDVIERIDLDNGERIVVASDPDSNPQGLVWSLDRREPVGAVYGGMQPKTQFFDEAHPHARLLRAMEQEFPNELAHITSASRDGSLAVVMVEGAKEPSRYYLLHTGTGKLELLVKSRPWLNAADMAPTRPVEFKARDGLSIRGWLTRPEGSAPVPLVLMPHGGPFDVEDEWYYDSEVQMLATRGYAVLRVNFRGSGGRGRDFMEAGYRQWGAAMQDDLTDATRWAIANAGVDARRICIWGGSYGGYAALMGAVREPDLYRCVVGFAGPYDLSLMYSKGDIRRSRYGRGFLRTTLGKDEAELERISPASHAGEIKAGILLVHGMLDERVPPAHAKAMKRALDKAGKYYETYFPAQEAHGFYGDASRRKYYDTVLAFLDKHLR